MTDHLTKERRSWNMSRIKSKGTKPELLMKQALQQAGYRFTMHNGQLPGKPDFFIKKHNLIIFVHGCFWHRHKRCKIAYTPKSKKEFWLKKFAENVARDQRQLRQLRRMGYAVHVFWECQIKNTSKLKQRMQTLKDHFS